MKRELEIEQRKWAVEVAKEIHWKRCGYCWDNDGRVNVMTCAGSARCSCECHTHEGAINSAATIISKHTRQLEGDLASARTSLHLSDESVARLLERVRTLETAVRDSNSILCGLWMGFPVDSDEANCIHGQRVRNQAALRGQEEPHE